MGKYSLEKLVRDYRVWIGVYFVITVLLTLYIFNLMRTTYGDLPLLIPAWPTIAFFQTVLKYDDIPIDLEKSAMVKYAVFFCIYAVQNSLIFIPVILYTKFKQRLYLFFLSIPWVWFSFSVIYFFMLMGLGN